MKIVTLVENTGNAPQLQTEHGLSLYIETETMKILFDMGQTDAFARNAEALGIDLSAVDFAIVSHGHYDHGGGLEKFLQINKTAPIYIHERAFGEYYNGTDKYIGLRKDLRDHSRLVFTKGVHVISQNVLLRDCNELCWEVDSWGLNCRGEDSFYADDFLHEQYLEITEGEKRVLVSGCSHKGILNIAAHFQPDVLIGGFHLSKQEDPVVLQEIAKQLLAGNTRYFTGHCTGQKQFTIMKAVMKRQLEFLSTGMIFEV